MSDEEEMRDLRTVASAMATYVPEQSLDDPSIEQCQWCKATWRYYRNDAGRHRVQSDGHKVDCPVVIARRWM